MKLILLPLNLTTWVQSLGSMWQEARIDSCLCLTAKIIVAASSSCPTLSPLFLFLLTLFLLSPLYFPLLQNPVWFHLQGSWASASWKTELQRTYFPLSQQSTLRPESLISLTVYISCAPLIPSYLRCPPLLYHTAFNQESYWYFFLFIFSLLFPFVCTITNILIYIVLSVAP